MSGPVAGDQDRLLGVDWQEKEAGTVGKYLSAYGLTAQIGKTPLYTHAGSVVPVLFHV